LIDYYDGLLAISIEWELLLNRRSLSEA